MPYLDTGDKMTEEQQREITQLCVKIIDFLQEYPASIAVNAVCRTAVILCAVSGVTNEQGHRMFTDLVDVYINKKGD